MLGGNAEYHGACTKCASMQFSEELIGEATGYGYTDDEEILNARKTFAGAQQKI